MPRFENVGLYDAVFVMQDIESKTLWNHITGEALYGPHVGHTLGPMGNMLQMNVEQALVMTPDIRVALSDRAYLVGDQQVGTGRRMSALSGSLDEERRLMPMFVETLGAEDTRLPRMTIGLGIVTEDTVRFYPKDLIEERGTVIDHVDGRTVLIFVDSATFTPAALFVDASSATLDDDDREIHLDTGSVVRMGVLYDANGNRVDVERPQQLFSRWYGFALTFPAPEVFGQ